VSRPRRAVPVRSLPTGYVLDAAVDITQFQDLASVREIAGALALWRGELPADLGPPEFARATATRLSELRLGLLEDGPADPAAIAAPFGPSRPSTVPASTVRSRPASAVTSPYR
jgi:Bacterial transcriptional activator domain